MNRAHWMTTRTVALVAVLTAGCGSSDPTTPSGGNASGGDNGAGGSPGNGGTSNSGGSASGGASNSGGSASGGASNSGGTGNSGGSASGGAGTTGGVTGSGGAAGPVCTSGTGKCNNPTDCAIKKSDMEGWEPPCAQASLGAAGPTATCMVGHGLTQGCADCWGSVAACGAQKCFTPCLADPNGTPCRDCTAQNCDAAFATCSGI